MKTKKYLIITLILSSVILCKGQTFIPIWPENEMPNSRGLKLEYVEERERITQVDIPGIYAFLISPEINSGTAVLICPSGGYQKLTYNKAGFQFAKWLNTLGINAFVLIYRLPDSPDLLEREKGPVQDAQRAMKYIRANASKYGIDPNKIGLMGASAGGHLVSTLGTHNTDFALIGDSLDQYSYKPSFMIMISSVVNMGEYTHQGSRKSFLGESPTDEKINLYSNEKQVNKNTPPAFLVHAHDDHGVSPMNSILFYQALLKYNIPASMHIFPKGDHAVGLRNNPGSTNLWPSLCEAWLIEMGFIKN